MLCVMSTSNVLIFFLKFIWMVIVELLKNEIGLCFRGCFLTSSLIATLAMSLNIPLTMLADVAVKHISYPVLFYVGSIPMFLSFFAVTLLAHWEEWDPIGQFFKNIIEVFRSRKR